MDAAELRRVRGLIRIQRNPCVSATFGCFSPRPKSCCGSHVSGLRRHVSTKKGIAYSSCRPFSPETSVEANRNTKCYFCSRTLAQGEGEKKKKGFGLLDEFCVISLLVLTAGLPSKATLMLWSTNLFFTQKETPTCIAQTGELNLSRGSSGYDRCHAGHVTDAASSGP